MKPTLLIMAAGIGSRYGNLKQIDSVGMSGEAIMEYSAYMLLRQDLKKLYLLSERALKRSSAK